MQTESLSFVKDLELDSDTLSCDQTIDDSCSVMSSEISHPTWKKSVIIKPKSASGLNIFIVKRIEDEESTALCLDMIKILRTFKANIFVEEACLEELKIKDSQKSEFHEFKDELSIDLLVVIGGDGSILWALKYFQNEKALPPVLAFSKGTLNYLCNFGTENFETTLGNIMESIASGKSIQVENRFRLQCEIFEVDTDKKRTLYALNEIALDRGIHMNIVKLDCLLEDKYFATFEGDGVMVATPTGSTAYQLSAGGPIINPLNSSMAVTPLAPMNMSTRPVVLPSDVTLSFKLREDSRKSAFLSADGQTRIEIKKGMEVRITGSTYPIPFILNEDKDTVDNWIIRLRDLLGWNKR